MCLGDVASTTSVKSTDLECLARLQDLAEAELCMKRHISELERREETYMKTLQQADELWSKMESDGATTVSALQEQLQLKASANQQLADKVSTLEDIIEKLNSKLANCKSELDNLQEISCADEIVGDESNAQVADKDSMAKTSTVDQCTSKIDENKDQMVQKCASLKTIAVSCRDQMVNKSSSAKAISSKDQMVQKCVSSKTIGVSCKDEMINKCSSAKTINVPSKDKMVQKCASSKTVEVSCKDEVLSKCLSAKTINVPSKDKMIQKCASSKTIGISCKDETLDRCVSAKRVNIASKEQMTEDDDYISCKDSDSEGEPCAPDFVCNDVVFSPTGIEDASKPLLKDSEEGPKCLSSNICSPLEAKESYFQLYKPNEDRQSRKDKSRPIKKKGDKSSDNDVVYKSPSDSEGEICGANVCYEDDSLIKDVDQVAKVRKDSKRDEEKKERETNKKKPLQEDRNQGKGSTDDEDQIKTRGKPIKSRSPSVQDHQKRDGTNGSTDQKTSNIEDPQESKETDLYQDDPKGKLGPDDVSVPRKELKSWLESTTNIEKTIVVRIIIII